MSRESLLLFNIENVQAAAIKRMADNMRIRVRQVPTDKYDYTLGDLCDGRDGEPQVNSVVSGSASLLVFANVTDKHMDKILFELKSRQIAVDYKAVMTPTNREWNIHRLMFEMEKEKRAYQNNL